MKEHRFAYVTYMSDEEISTLLNNMERDGWTLAGSMFDLNTGCRLIFEKPVRQPT